MRSVRILAGLLAAGLGGLSGAAAGSAYQVFGQRYRVLDRADGYVERGVASWYGHPFHGNATASGERFDMHALTAAHRTLPIATTALVTNLRNGKSVVVRINDRGPFVDGRVIDLSRAAGRELDLLDSGIAQVEVRALPRRAPAFVQVGAYAELANAERMRARLASAGLEPLVVSEEVGGRRLQRVRLAVADGASSRRVVERLRGLGIGGALVDPER